MTKLPVLVKSCEECKLEFKTKKVSQRFCCISCQRKFSSRLRLDELRLHFSMLATKRHQNGDVSFGWKTRSIVEPSYPEKYFISLFEKEGIEVQREVKVGRFFIDFVLPGNIALEIDGRQHDDPVVMEKDARKDIVLRKHGYEVVRIRWYNPVSAISKKLLYDQIDALLVIVATRVPGMDEKSGQNRHRAPWGSNIKVM